MNGWMSGWINGWMGYRYSFNDRLINIRAILTTLNVFYFRPASMSVRMVDKERSGMMKLPYFLPFCLTYIIPLPDTNVNFMTRKGRPFSCIALPDLIQTNSPSIKSTSLTHLL